MTDSKIVLSGSWEKKSRNPVLASFILVFICGGLYFFISSIILQTYIYIDVFVNKATPFSAGMDLIEEMQSFYERYKYVSLALTAIFQYIVFLVLPVMIIKKWHTRQINEYFQYHHLHITGIILSVLGVVFIIPLVDMISQFVYRLLPVFERLSEVSKPLLTARNPFEMIFVVFVISITPAICEEAIFRGYFQRTLQRKIRFPWHFIISGFVFALFHQQTLSLLALFLVGVYLGYIYYCYNSIYVSMAAHGIYNFILICLLNIKEIPAALVTEKGYFRMQVIVVSLVFFLLIVYLVYRTRIQKSDVEMVYVTDEIQDKDMADENYNADTAGE